MTKTRKSTPKYEIYSTIAFAVIVTGVSRTNANEIARGMGKNIIVRPVSIAKTKEA